MRENRVDGLTQDGVQPNLDLHDMLLQVGLGYTASQVLNVFARLEIADHLAHDSQSSDELASTAGTAPQPTRRLLRAATALGLLREPEPGTYKLTSFGALLRSNVEGSLRQTIRLFCSDNSWDAWRELEHSIRTGESGWSKNSGGRPTFEFFDDDPEMGRVFNDAMAEGTNRVAPALAESYDFGRFTTLVDVGGGNGALLRPVLEAHPNLCGIVLDLEAGCAEAATEFAAAGLTDRTDIVVGDFFESVPAGHDAYIMKSVIHDWNDDECVQILRRCREAVDDDGRVFILEPIIPERIEGMEHLGNLMGDLNMLAVASGRERTEDEFRQLFTRGGFPMTSIIGPIGAFNMHLMEGTPA